ncbi:oligomeric, coiled-coil, peripheral membrane protein [Rhizoclosmatium sp. JEL0117]|nr:oligomeric, coiled-coil, peripheral membrane protein [Rhizoclosmatium sp. JEL0117]
MAQLSQNLKSVSAAFGQLLHVHRMPAAWGAVIVEIVRRREFLRVWMERAERVAEGFGRVGEGEKRRREGFDEAVGKYLPKAGNGRALVEGLEEGVPKVEVRVVRAGDKGNGLPILTRSDVAEFEQFISQIRAAMTDVDPSSSAAANTNNQHTILSSHSSAGNPADSISKLQATMTKMIPQLDSLIPDFDRAVARSGVCGDRVMKLEDENARLRAELNLLKNSGKNPISAAASPVTVATPLSMTPSVPAPNQQIQSRRIPVPKAMSAGSFDGDWAKAEETIKAYENRIRTLEDLLQRSYHMEKSNMIMNQSTSTGSDPALQQLQTENQTLKTRLALLESQFNTTSTSLQSKESRLKEAHAEREKLKLTHESERNVLKSRCSVLEKELNDLRHQLQEKDKEGRVVVGEVERCAGFVREVYELLDDCAGAFKIRGDESPSPQQEARLANQPLAVQTRGSSTASSLGKYQSPTSPSAGLMAIVNAATSFGSNPAGSSNPSSLSNIPRNNSNPVSSPLLQQPPVVLAILSNLRTDEREIRRRLRELQDDIRCQTLELVGVQDELAAIGAAASRNYDGTAESSAYESSNARYAEEVGIGEMSPRTEQSRSGISNTGGRGVHSLAMEELHASKREIQRLNAVVEELSLEVETARREAIEARERYEEMKEDVVGRESHISQLQDALGRLNEEKADWIETEGQVALKVERLTKTLETVQAEKGDVERKLDSLGKEAAALQEKYSRVDEEWKAKWNQQSLVVQNWEGQVKAVNARLLQREAEFTEKLMDAEAVHTELNHTISSLQQTIADLDAHIHSTEAKYSSVDMTLRQKDGEISRLEETCEKLRLSLGREKGRIIKLKEKIEDWNVVCKMAVECLTVRFEALGSMGDALAEMDTFVDRFVKESLGLQANVTKLVGDEANPLKLKQSDLDSFKHAVNMASSMSNSIGEDHDFSAAVDTKLSSPVELRDVYLNMIQLVDSVDISGWSDTVVRSCHNWKEMILTQSLRKAMLQGPKIAYTG